MVDFVLYFYFLGKEMYKKLFNVDKKGLESRVIGVNNVSFNNCFKMFVILNFL